MTQVKAVFYIPLRDNDGRDLAVETEELKTELYILFVGWTFLGYVKGAYQMADGSQAIDEHGAYMVVLDKPEFRNWSKCSAISRARHCKSLFISRSSVTWMFDSFAEGAKP